MTQRIEVDPIACQAHGICAELLPELIELDDWGYPVIADVDVPRPAAPARPAGRQRVPDAGVASACGSKGQIGLTIRPPLTA